MLCSKFKVFRDSRIAIDLTFSLRGEEYFKAGNLQFIVTLTRITFVVSLICPLYDQEDFGDVHFKAFHFMININSSREKKATRKPLPQYGNFCRAAKWRNSLQNKASFLSMSMVCYLWFFFSFRFTLDFEVSDIDYLSLLDKKWFILGTKNIKTFESSS